MELYEYQGLEMLARYGLPVPVSQLARTPEQAVAAAAHIGGPVVVKAQVRAGGRGKAGGVRRAADPQAAGAVAEQMLGSQIQGHLVGAVLVAQAVELAEEYYFSYLLDRTNRTFLLIASPSGGMDIEQVARQTPELVCRVPIDRAGGVDVTLARRVVTDAGFPPAVTEPLAECVVALWQVMVAQDAVLVEVNPLARLADGRLCCLDAKVTLDDNARFRHPDRTLLLSEPPVDRVERLAMERNLNYVPLDGQVGVIGNGAGLVMSTLDVVAAVGERFGVRPANFLDIGGGASEAVLADALDTVLADDSVKTVFINVFGGITACDVVAKGILGAVDRLDHRGDPLSTPLVVRLDGNRAEQGRKILAAADHRFIELVETMDEAAKLAAELAGAAGERHGSLA